MSRRLSMLALSMCITLLLIGAVRADADATEDGAPVKKKKQLEEETVQSTLRLMSQRGRPVPDERKHPHIETVLAYVTPWNKAVGYELAIKYTGSVITHVSPVWYDVSAKPGEAGGFRVTGESHYNATFVQTVVERGGRVLPRFRLNLGTKHLTQLLADVNVQGQFADALRPAFTKHKGYFSGVVLDAANIQLKAPGQRKRFGQLVENVRATLDHALGAKAEVVLVIPADHDLVGPTEVSWLSQQVDFLSLMTYDYNRQPTPNFLAPEPWMKRISEPLAKSAPEKVLVGLCFYGYSYASSDGAANTLPSPITAEEYSNLLKFAVQNAKEAAMKKDPNAKVPTVPLTWNKEAKEHTVQTATPKKGAQTVYFPSRAFIKHRLNMVDKLPGRQGVSIWELGQGMEAFLEMF